MYSVAKSSSWLVNGTFLLLTILLCMHGTVFDWHCILFFVESVNITVTLSNMYKTIILEHTNLGIREFISYMC